MRGAGGQEAAGGGRQDGGLVGSRGHVPFGTPMVHLREWGAFSRFWGGGGGSTLSLVILGAVLQTLMATRCHRFKNF